MKKLFIGFSFLFYFISVFSQSFEIKQITSGDFDAKNPIISVYGFTNGWIYFEKHSDSLSNIILIEYNAFSNSFQDTIELTSGNAVRINPYEDFNQGIVFQTNENGNWDIAFRPYDNGNWGPISFLTDSPEDEFNLSPFYMSEIGFPSNNFILFQRADTIIMLEYNESVITEYPVFVNTPQYHYSDYIGIYYNYSPNNYPRVGIHVVAVEIDSMGNRNLVYKYKPLFGQWEEKSYIQENCECRNPSLQKFYFTPGLIFEDSTSNGFRPFSVYDWELEKDIEPIPDLLSGNLIDFKIDQPDIITSNPYPSLELEFFPHTYFVKDEDDLQIRLNKLELGDVVGDTLITVNYNSSRMAHGALGFWNGEVFYTIWEDSSAGSVHLFGRRQLYPIDGVSDENGIDGFILEQNYPNPFNPSTSIQYAIGSLPDSKAGRQFVTLKVYDVLGNEIATLVNEEKPAGEYEVEFNIYSDGGQNLSSGIYFYQLVIRGSEINSEQVLIQTKKMVLLK